jgi:hypothetical protein
MDLKDNPLIIALASSMVGLLPVVLTLIVNWLEKRGQASRINSILGQVNNRIEFLTAWYNLQKEVTNSDQLTNIRKIVNNELGDVYELFMDVVLDPDKDTKQRQEAIAKYRKTNGLQRFLLVYTPYNARGWVFHTLYYMCLLPLLALVGYMIYGGIQFNNPLHGLPLDNQTLIYVGLTVVLLVISHRMGRVAAKDIENRMVKLEQKTTPLRTQSA